MASWKPRLPRAARSAAHAERRASEDGPAELRAVPSEPFDVEPPYDAPAPTTSTRRPVPRPRAVLAALQPAGARAGRGPDAAAARAGAVPGDLRQQPRRVLHGPGGRPQAPDRRRRRRPRRLRADAARGARADLGEHPRADGAARARSSATRSCPALAKEGIELVRWDELDRDEQKQLQAALQGAGLPGADAAGGRPGPPVPLHLRALAQPRRAGAQPEDRQGALRPGQGAADLRRFVPLGNQRFVPLEDVIGEHLKRLFPGMEVLEVHTFRVTRNEDLEVEEDDAENLLEGAGEGAAAPPLRPAGAARGRGVDRRRTCSSCWSPSSASPTDEVFRAARPARPAPGCTASPTSTGEELKYPAFVPDAPTRSSPRSSRPRPVDVFKATAALRRTAAPPLRLVRHLGAAVHRAGRRRPARAGDQADALPHLGRLPDHRRPRSTPPRPASRCWCSSRSRPASTSRPTSAGPASSSRPAATSSTGWSG